MPRKKATEDEPIILLDAETDEETSVDESTDDGVYTSPVTEEIDRIFGESLNPGFDDDNDVEEEPESEEDTVDEPVVQSERLLNANEFKLLQITNEGDRKYQVGFTADDLNISTSRTFQAESMEKHPFETILDQIADAILPLAFSDQKRGHLTMTRLKRVIKQNKKKEPITEYEVSARNVGGKNPYTSTDKGIQLSQLPKDFQGLFIDLENHLKEEISKKHSSNEQLGFDFSEEEEE